MTTGAGSGGTGNTQGTGGSGQSAGLTGGAQKTGPRGRIVGSGTMAKTNNAAMNGQKIAGSNDAGDYVLLTKSNENKKIEEKNKAESANPNATAQTNTQNTTQTNLGDVSQVKATDGSQRTMTVTRDVSGNMTSVSVSTKDGKGADPVESKKAMDHLQDVNAARANVTKAEQNTDAANKKFISVLKDTGNQKAIDLAGKMERGESVSDQERLDAVKGLSPVQQKQIEEAARDVAIRGVEQINAENNLGYSLGAKGLMTQAESNKLAADTIDEIKKADFVSGNTGNMGALVGKLKEQTDKIKGEISKVNDQIQEVNKQINEITKKDIEKQKEIAARKKRAAIFGSIMGIIGTIVSIAVPGVGTAIGAGIGLLGQLGSALMQ